MLSDRDIRRAIKDKLLVIDPFDPLLINPCSIDMRLDPRYRVFTAASIDMAHVNEHHTQLRHADDDNGVIALLPGAFILCSSVEQFQLGNMLCARVEGKSSLGRLGLSIHETAGFIDPGFVGNITFEVKNNLPNTTLYLRPGQKIAQLAFSRLSSVPEKTYQQTGRYIGKHAAGPVESKFTLT